MFIANNISVAELAVLSEKMASPIVKGVADIKQGIVVLDAFLHADEEAFLLQNGSRQSDLWGFNLVPDKFGSEEFVIFDSMINLRPWDGNRSRIITNTKICAEITKLISGIVHD